MVVLVTAGAVGVVAAVAIPEGAAVFDGVLRDAEPVVKVTNSVAVCAEIKARWVRQTTSDANHADRNERDGRRRLESMAAIV